MNDYRDFAIDLARQAGAITRKNFGLNIARDWKSDNSPITETDLAINKMVVDAVAAAYPEHRVIGEEQNSVGETDGEWAWVCDPVDGTMAFSSGIPVSTFSLALTRYGKSILGVVLDPFMDRLLVGEQGQGATLNNEPISVSSAPTLDLTVTDLETGHGQPAVGHAIREDLKKRGAIVCSFYSSVHASMLVACGRFSGVIHTYPYPWDAAAVAVIVAEAGGVVTDIAGKDQLYDRKINGFIASNGLVHDELVAAAATEDALMS